MKKKTLLLFFVCSVYFLFSCKKSSIGLNNNTTNNGGTTHPTYTLLSLGGTKWSLYQYKDATLQNPITRTDTFIFIDSVNYTYNNHPNKYNIINSAGSLYFNLMGTPFGDLYARPSANFMTYGEINDVPFTQQDVPNPMVYSIWMKKI
jgi:hypothetical protein